MSTTTPTVVLPPSATKSAAPAAPAAPAVGSMVIGTTGGFTKTRIVSPIEKAQMALIGLTAAASATFGVSMAVAGFAVGTTAATAAAVAAIAWPITLALVGILAIVYAANYFANREVKPSTIPTAPAMSTPAQVKQQIALNKLAAVTTAKQTPLTMKAHAEKAVEAVLKLEEAKVKTGDKSLPPKDQIEASKELALAKAGVIAANHNLSHSYANEVVVNGLEAANKVLDTAIDAERQNIRFDSVYLDVSIRDIVLNGSDKVEIDGLNSGMLFGIKNKILDVISKRFTTESKVNSLENALEELDTDISNSGLNKGDVFTHLSNAYAGKEMSLARTAAKDIYNRIGQDPIAIDEDLDALVGVLANKLVNAGPLAEDKKDSFIKVVTHLVVTKYREVEAEALAKATAKVKADVAAEMPNLTSDRTRIKNAMITQLGNQKTALETKKGSNVASVLPPTAASTHIARAAAGNAKFQKNLAEADGDYKKADLVLNGLEIELKAVEGKISALEKRLVDAGIKVEKDALDAGLTQRIRSIKKLIEILLPKQSLAQKAGAAFSSSVAGVQATASAATSYAASWMPSAPSLGAVGSFFSRKFASASSAAAAGTLTTMAAGNPKLAAVVAGPAAVKPVAALV